MTLAAVSFLPGFAVQPADQTVDPVQPVDPSLEAFGVTSDARDTYALTVDGRTVTATAAADNVGSNTRVMFRPVAALPTVNQQACATWEPGTDAIQPGVGLRVVHEDGSFRALMISQNIFWYSVYVFNVHLVDTSHERPILQLGHFDLSDGLAPDGTHDSLLPGPWRMCARAVGSELAVKVWSLEHPEPEWDDERHAGTLELPKGWDYAGHSGWYVGHLPPGGTLSLSDLTTTGLALRSLVRQARNRVVAAVVLSRP